MATHGMRNSREYSSWISMKRRCCDETHKDYKRYGAVGVVIFAPWLTSFQDFFDHIGPRPPETTLDRIDGTKGYEPGNVKWSTAAEQAINRKSSYVWHIRGRVFDTIGEAAACFSVSAQTVHRWVNGAFDARRGTFTNPRSDCRATPRYEK